MCGFGKYFFMNRSTFARTIDICFVVFGFGVVAYAWANKFIKNIWLSLFLTGLFCFLIAKIFVYFDKKINNKYNLKKTELEYAEMCIDYFCKHKKESVNFFAKLFGATKKSSLFVENSQCVYYIDYSSETTNLSTICKIVDTKQKQNSKNYYILCNSLSQKASGYAKQNQISSPSMHEVFVLMKEKNMFPVEYSTQKQERVKFKQKMRSLIEIKKAKHYIFYGTLLIVLSFIVPFAWWYIVFGTLLICLSILSIFAGISKKLS